MSCTLKTNSILARKDNSDIHVLEIIISTLPVKIYETVP